MGYLKILFVCLLVLCSFPKTGLCVHIGTLIFHTTGNTLKINDHDSIPPYQKNIKNYELQTLNTRLPVTITFGNETKTIHLKNNIKKNDYITLILNSHTVKLHLYPKEIPNYTITSVPTHSKGILLFSPYVSCQPYPSYALATDTKGDLIFYYKGTNNKTISDFKKTTLNNGQIRYSFMMQEEKAPPCHYLGGSLYVFDENFNLLNKHRLKRTKTHDDLPVENHDSRLISDTHYFLSSYYNQEAMHPILETPVNITSLILQEIKDNQVIFDFNSANYPELWTHCTNCDWNEIEWQDSVHFNSILIDPKDNNLILSFATTSSVVKIDRKTEKKLWQLGGEKDDFNLKTEFLFVGQHALSFDNNGYLMLYDNQSRDFFSHKSHRKPLSYSRILKFKLDEKNNRVLDVKEQKLNYKSISMGSVYQLKKPNRYFVSYGSNTPVSAQEIDEQGNVYLTLELEQPYVSYKVRHTQERP